MQICQSLEKHALHPVRCLLDVSQTILFTPMQLCSSINLELHVLNPIRIHANADLLFNHIEQHARHLAPNPLVRVEVHLVHANALSCQSHLNNMLFISFEVSSYASQSILFTTMQFCQSLEQHAHHLIRSLLARVAVHLVHA